MSDSMEKQCSYCKQTLPLESFHRRRLSKDGRGFRCKSCQKAYDKARDHGERRAKAISRFNDWKKKNPGRARIHRLKYEYGLVEGQYEAMAAYQEGKCAICKQEVFLVVDHCHGTKIVRGLLCNPCNTAIGTMQDDPERLRSAADYLERFKAP